LLDEVYLAAALRVRGDAEALEEAPDLARRCEPSRLVRRAELASRREGDVAEPDCLAEQTFGHAPQFLRLRVRGFDPLVQYQVRRQRAKHRAAVTGVAAELTALLSMSHDCLAVFSPRPAAPSTARASGASSRASGRGKGPSSRGSL